MCMGIISNVYICAQLVHKTLNSPKQVNQGAFLLYQNNPSLLRFMTDGACKLDQLGAVHKLRHPGRGREGVCQMLTLDDMGEGGSPKRSKIE